MAETMGTIARNLQADAIGDSLDSGTLSIYTGSKPASPDDAATGTLLVAFTLPATAFDDAIDGVAALDETPLVEPGLDTGDAGWFRLANAADTLRYDGTVTATGDGGDMQLNTISIVEDEDVTITAGSITQPAS